jgi:Ca2+-binding EF-hand superfamily protein
MPRFAFAFVSFLPLLPLAAAAEPTERYLRAVKAEDETARRLVERIQKPGESERERWFKRLDEVFTGQVPDDPARWYDLVTVGRPVWTRDGSRYFAEFHERVADRMELRKTDPVSRDEFAAYARLYLGSDSPPWKVADVDGEARGPFKHLDADRDGKLTPAECSPGLEQRFDQYDANRDGAIDLGEYLGYFRGRVEYEVRTTVPLDDRQKEERRREEQLKEQQAKEVAKEAEEERAAKGAVLRDHSQLPKEVPVWFGQYDDDRDLQVGLYEWRKANRPIAEFTAMDLNGDGLLEVAEYLRYAKRKAEGGLPDLRAGVKR